MTGEAAAGYIKDLLYGEGTNIADLTQEQKENISNLAQIASGLAVAAGGGSISDIGTSVAGSKNAVENNVLGPIETSRLQFLQSQLINAKTEEDKAVIQAEIDYIHAIDKATDEYIKDVCQTGSKTSDACQAAYKIVADMKAQYDAKYSAAFSSNPLLVRELFYNKEAAEKVDAAFAQSEAGVWMYTLENYMNTHGVSFEEAYEKHKLLIDVNVMANIASYLIMTKVAVDVGYKPVSTGKGNAANNVATAEDLLAGKGTSGQSANIIKGFNQTETKIIFEAKNILNSEAMSQIQQAHASGQSVTVVIDGRVIQ